MATSLTQLGLLLQLLGEHGPARPLLERALNIRQQALGPNHLEVGTSAQNLARLLTAMGDYAPARSLYERAIRIREQALGPAHPDVASSLDGLANVLQVTGDYASARPLYERALRITEAALGPNDPEVAGTLNNFARLLQATADYAGAKPLYERALAIQEGSLGSNHPGLAATLNNLAGLLQATGDYTAARPMYERALRIKEQALGPNHPDVATILSNLAGLLKDTADYAGARSMYERALRIDEQALGPSHPGVATTLNNLGELLQATGDYAGARPLYERALHITEAALGPNHPEVATTLSNLGLLLRATGDYAGARALYERALRIKEQALGPSHPGVATTLNNLGELLQATGEYGGARSLHERALRITEAALGPNHPDVAVRLSNLAVLLEASADYAPARGLYERALRIKEQALGPSHPDVGLAFNNLAHLLYSMGDYSAAMPLYERALRVYGQRLGPSHPLVAMGLDNLALLLQATGDYAGAKPLFERALNIRQQTLGPNHPDVAKSLNGLANVLRATSDYAGAKPLYERALAIQEQSLGSSHPDVATTLNDLGLLLQAREGGDAGVRLPLYERALRINEQAFGPAHPWVATVLNNLAILNWEAGRPREAVAKLARAVTITRAHTARGLVGLSQRQKLVFLETTSEYTDIFLSLPSGLVPTADAYGAVLDRKNLLFRTLTEERAMTEANPSPGITAILEDYSAVRRQLSVLATRSPNPPDVLRYRTDIASLTQRLETLEAQLSRGSAVFRQAQMAAIAGAPDVCATIPADAALIDLFWYVRYTPPAAPGVRPVLKPHYDIFVLRGGDCKSPIRVEAGAAGPIDDDVRRFREALSREAPDPTARELRARYRQTLAARFRAKLFSPDVQAAIAGKPRLFISPDGTLALLPFALLPGDDGHEFLLETRTISYVPSGRDLLRAAPSSTAPGGLLALGAPAFDRAPVQVAQTGGQRAGCGTPEDPFAPLPGTLAEVRAITRVYQQTNPTRPAMALEGTQATKAAFLERVPKASVLHLATHAYFAGEDCTPAGLVSGQRGLGGDSPGFLGHNPLLLAGIGLSGANDRDRADGILTALEVTTLDLRGTDLVVLSACDTGLGTAARGQELLGLRWAFAYAGAKNLVTSLWSVPDVETASLMTRFYTALWEKGLSVPAALRAAQLEMLKAARARGDSAPHTWGAFVTSGKLD